MQRVFEIYKHDKWNMMKVEQLGTRFTVREISTEWGEECRVFLTRHELWQFAEQRFGRTEVASDPEETERILAIFKEICQ